MKNNTDKFVGCKLAKPAHRKFRILAAKKSLSASALLKSLAMAAVAKSEEVDEK